jgi:hypothetical protein
VYNGEFANNNIHGYGEDKWADGRKYGGTGKNNKMDGTGVSSWPDGRVY